MHVTVNTTSFLGRLLEHLVAHPEYKLLTLQNIPQMSENSRRYSSFQWHGLLKHLRQMLIADSPMEEGDICFQQIFSLIHILD